MELAETADIDQSDIHGSWTAALVYIHLASVEQFVRGLGHAVDRQSASRANAGSRQQVLVDGPNCTPTTADCECTIGAVNLGSRHASLSTVNKSRDTDKFAVESLAKDIRIRETMMTIRCTVKRRMQ